MGLGFVNCDAHWSYSGFNRFRERLVAEVGICLPLMEGFYGKVENTKLQMGLEIVDNHLSWLPKNPLKWDNIIDPLVSFLNHSDCEGELTSKECEEVAPRLRIIVANWDDDDVYKMHALLLADGMDKCVKENVPLEFC